MSPYKLPVKPWTKLWMTALLNVGLCLPLTAKAIEFDSKTLAQVRSASNLESSNQQNSQLAELSIKPEINAEFSNGLKFTAIGRLRTQNISGLQAIDVDRDGYSALSKPIYLSDSTELELREFFFEKSFGKHYLTAGKQQIVWGKSDGLKVLDIVNPQSFNEFILDSFEDSRIPLWAINLESPITDTIDLQMIWVIDQTTHALPTIGSTGTYRFTTPRLAPVAPEGVAVNIESVERPANKLKNSDFGLRLSTFTNGWDLTLNYLYQTVDLPVLYQQVELTPTPTVTITPQFERSHLLGGTFSNTFGDLTLRGELGFASNRRFINRAPTADRGISKHDELSYVLGLDWYGLEQSLVSFQLFQSRLFDYDTNLTRPRTDTTVTLLAQRDFLNETLKAEVLFLKNLDDSDSLIRPKLSYEWSDKLKVWAAADIFSGNQEGLFGQYDDNDRVLIGAEYGF